MKTYLIKRDIPEAGKLTARQLKAIAIKSCGVVEKIGPQIEWLHSYIAGNNLFCIYRAESEDIIREHGAIGGFPVNQVYEIFGTFSPATAKEPVAETV